MRRSIQPALFGAALCAAAPALADPMLGIGLTIGFGGGEAQVGVSGNVWHNDEENEFVAGVGGTYYPGTGGFGAHVGLGYTTGNVVLGGGYDFINGDPVAIINYADTQSDDDDDDEDVTVADGPVDEVDECEVFESSFALVALDPCLVR